MKISDNIADEMPILNE